MTKPSTEPDERGWGTFIAFFDVWGPDQLERFLETWTNSVPNCRTVELVVPPMTLAEPHRGITGFTLFRMKWGHMREASAWLSRIEQAGAQVTLLPTWDNGTLAEDLARYRRGQRTIAQAWQSATVTPITEWGATTRLEVLPLVDWRTRRPELRTELGVAYLVRTDDRTMLFDLGRNARETHPSPLLHNMAQLGLALDDVETIVISHNHGDHVGGSRWSRNRTFSLTTRQLPLPHTTVYTPEPMTYPGLSPIHARHPTVIGTGVATIGTIDRQLFGESIFDLTTGRTPEQAVAVRVKDRGLVLIVGCGHQTLPKILDRAAALFDDPLYGIIGGLHYAVDGGHIALKGMAPHKYIGTGNPPWRPITRRDLHRNIALLQSLAPQLVALSPHDSSPTSLTALQRAFPTAYRDLYVGESLVVAR